MQGNLANLGLGIYYTELPYMKVGGYDYVEAPDV